MPSSAWTGAFLGKAPAAGGGPDRTVCGQVFPWESEKELNFERKSGIIGTGGRTDGKI